MLDYLTKIAEAVLKGDEKLVTQMVDEALAARVAAKEILDKGLIPGIQTLGQLFKDGQAYLPEVLISARTMRIGIDKLTPLFTSQDIPKKGAVVMGTVAGDVHDIGKNLVRMMLECNGYKVHDLGQDVPASLFVKATHDIKPDIVAMSALLTTTLTHIPQVVKALEQAGVRSKVKIMIGGAPITRQFADKIGVEGYADNCASAVDEADRLVSNGGDG